jgi:hypothetical protein
MAKDKSITNIQVLDTQTSEREYNQYIPGTSGTSSTNCSSNANVYGTGGIATANGTTNCTTTSTPGSAPTFVRHSIEQEHVRAVLPDGRHITLWCQAGFRRCAKLEPGDYSAEISGNTVRMVVFELDGVKTHKIKFRFAGGW